MISAIVVENDVFIATLEEKDDIEIIYEKTNSGPNNRQRSSVSQIESRGVLFTSRRRLLQPRTDCSNFDNTASRQVQTGKNVPKQESHFPMNHLPKELISNILGSLTTQDDLLRCRYVSKTWNALACIHLRYLHRPIYLEKANQAKFFVNTMRHRIHEQRIPFTGYNLNLGTLSKKSLEILLDQPGLNIRSLLITTGESYGKLHLKKGVETEAMLLLLLSQCSGLIELTLNLPSTIESTIKFFNKPIPIPNIRSIGLTNIMFNPTSTSLAAFRQFTQVQYLNLTKLKIHLHKAPYANPGIQIEMVDTFYQLLEARSSTLLDLEVNTSLSGVRLPILPKLKALALRVNENEGYGLQTFGSFSPIQFPVLEKLHFGTFVLRKTTARFGNSIPAFVGDTFPTVESLTLDHVQPEENHVQSFPNLRKLEVGPNVSIYYLQNIMSYFVDIEHLSLKLSPHAQDCWGALTGGAKRQQRESFETMKAVYCVEKRRSLGGPRRGACCLADLRKLKSLTVETATTHVLDALVYLTLNEFIHPLEELHILGTLDIMEYPHDLVHALRNYHGTVTVCH